MRLASGLLRVIVPFVLLVCALSVFVRGQSCTQQCGQLLTGGVFATSSFKQSGNQALVFQSWACQHSFQEVQKALSAGLDVHILGPLYGGSGQFSQSDFETQKQSSCSSINNQMSSDSASVQISKTGDPIIVNGFNKCMSTCSDGLSAYAETLGLNPVVHVSYRQAQGGPASVSISPPFSLPEGVVAAGRAGVDAHLLFADGTMISGPSGERSVVIDRGGRPQEFAILVSTLDAGGHPFQDATVRIPEVDAELHKQQQLSMVPVGAIIAYAGAVDAAHPLPEDWMLCDGSPMAGGSFPALFAAIGTANGDGRDLAGNKIADFNLPDLRGMFLRGTDLGRGVDPNRGTRGVPKAGGNSGDSVASVQQQATARPSSAFTTDVQGSHSHLLNLETTAGRANGTVRNTAAFPFTGPRQGSTSDAGAHAHTVIGGGDAETRPVNVNVNWIIRVK